jgi:hypothetical protein
MKSYTPWLIKEVREAPAYKIVSNQTLPLLMLVTPAQRNAMKRPASGFGRIIALPRVLP